MLQRFSLADLFCVACGFLCLPGIGHAQEAAPATSIRVQDGFRAELVRSAGAGEGSWISMTFDDRGRIILGRDDVGLARLTPVEGGPHQYELLDNTLRHCRGVLYAFDSLYVSATDSKGFYRLQDTDGDDRFDQVKLLKAMDYRSRYGHGTNQIVLGPDKMLYVVNGNDVSFPEGASPDSPYRDPRGDLLLPDPHDAGQDNRVGHILRTDAEGKTWEVVAGGFRNQVDVAFNADGEMFTWDADMEWDVGLPWYRPTRLNHVVSGGEYGWRWGTGKWPDYFADSLPSNLDTGLGSPTGLASGEQSNFPSRFRRALFMADWQNGRILAVHMRPKGASYECSYEVFLEGGPLNVCDMVFGPDGSLYFITGGRGSQSGLYRVSYMGTTEPAEPSAVDEAAIVAAAEARRLRRSLEAFHVRQAEKAVDLAWPHLDSDDPWLRWAARVAIERQEVEKWRQRALDEKRTNAAIAALLALVHIGNPADQQAVLGALERLPLDRLERSQLLAALRVYQLAFSRWRRPDDAAARHVAARLDALYPHSSSSVNRELCTLLVFLKSPTAVDKTLKLVEAASTQEEQIHYMHMLVRLETGWSIESRTAVLQWFLRAKGFRGGKLLPTVLKNMQADFVAGLSDEERKRLAAHLEALQKPASEQAEAPARPLVRHWRLEDLLAELNAARGGQSAALGKAALVAASCLKCHRLGDEGGQIGPDLTTVSKRFDKRMLLESILEPSKVIDPKYRSMAYILEDGKTIAGRPVGVSATQIVIETDPLTEATVTVPRASIEESSIADISPMPTGLVDTLTKEEIFALVDLLHGSGRPAQQ